MQLNGWSRLGVVISILFGALVTFVALQHLPNLDQKHNAWIGEASAAIAEAISDAEGRDNQPHHVREVLMRGGDAATIAWLEEVATNPSDEQKLFSATLGRVNVENKAAVAALPREQLTHWMIAFIWWLAGTAILFSSGLAVRWVYRGFQRKSV